MGPHYVKNYLQILKVVVFATALNGNIVCVAFNRLSQVIAKDSAHGALVSYAGVFQPEGHYCITEYSLRHSEQCMLFVLRIHLNLIIS